MCETKQKQQSTMVEALKVAMSKTAEEIQSATNMIKEKGVVEAGIEYGTPVVNKTSELINENITEPYLKDNEQFEYVKKVLSENGAVEGGKVLVGDSIEYTKQASEQVVQSLNEKKVATVSAVTERVEETRDAALEKYTEVKTQVDEKVAETKEAALEKYTEVKSQVDDKVTETKEAALKKYTEVKSQMDDKVTETRQTVTSKLQQLYQDYAATYVNMVLELASNYNAQLKGCVEQTTEYITAKWSGIVSQKETLAEELSIKKEAMIELAQNKSKFFNEFASEQKQEITATVQSVLTATEQVNAMVKEQGVMATARVGYSKASEISQPYVQKAQDYIKVTTPLTQAAA